MKTHTLNYDVLYADGSKVTMLVKVDDLARADWAAECQAAESCADRVLYVELNVDTMVAGTNIWQSGDCYGFFHIDGTPSYPHASLAEAEYAAAADYAEEVGDTDFFKPVEVKLPWRQAILSTLICLAAAWLVCHLTGYVWWFPVGMATYTLTSILCYWAFDMDNLDNHLETRA